MFKKAAVCLFLTLLSSIAAANTCPTINDIKQQHLNGWTAYDSDEGITLSPDRLNAFVASAQQFAAAQWEQQKNEKTGSIHCFYLDKDGSNLEAYLSKDNQLPVNKNKSWYLVTGALQCAASMENCSFQNSKSTEHQLADNR